MKFDKYTYGAQKTIDNQRFFKKIVRRVTIFTELEFYFVLWKATREEDKEKPPDEVIIA